MKFRSVILFNCYLVSLSLLYTQIYLNALPSIADNLQTSGSFIQFIFILNIFSFGVSQLFYGPLSDQYGRKKILIIGIIIVLIGNLISTCATNGFTFLFGQLINGFGAGSCSVIPRTISRDLFKDRDLIIAISYMSIGSTIAPGIAPFIGSLLETYLGWRSIFVLSMCLTFLTLYSVYFLLPETRPAYHMQNNMKKYKELFVNKRFILFALLNAFSYSSIIVYIMFSPFLFQTTLNIVPIKSSLVYIMCAGGYLSANLLLNHLLKRYAQEKILFIGISILILGSVLNAISILTNQISTLLLLSCGLTIHFACGLITPITYKETLSIPCFSSGVTSGAINASRVFISLIISSICLSINRQNTVLILYALSMLSIASCYVYYLILMNKKNEDIIYI